MSETENTASKQKGPWKKGQSGNPDGRPRGARNRATIMAERLIDEQTQGVVGKIVDMAMGGDVVCLKALLDRIIPPRKEVPVRLSLPPWTLRRIDPFPLKINDPCCAQNIIISSDNIRGA